MNYKKHTQDRFFERFKFIITDAEYDILCKMCNDNFIQIEPNRNRSIKKIIKYNNIYICCIISHKTKIIKTVYPVKRSKVKKYESTNI